MAYPKHASDGTGVPASPDLPAVERRVLEHWTADKTFEASVEQRPAGDNGANEYVFYDGPPFANGLPHYGHLFTGYVKDVVPRYQSMRGRRVERRFGWDTHGLPAEVVAERQLGITSKAEILDLGVAKFNDACRTSVLQYTHDWERYVNRQARWVDFGNDYKTLDLDYMESVMWAFQTLHKKGLIYEGFRVLAYCMRCETPLSNTETRMDDVYRERHDPTLTVWFQLDPTADGQPGEKIGVWTTTPWTLPSTWRLPSARTSSTPYSNATGSGSSSAPRASARTPRSWTGSPRSARCTAVTWSDAATPRCTTSWSSRPARTRTRCSGRSSSPPRTAPVWCTSPRRSARTTRTPATRPASRPSSRWTTTPGSPRWCRRTRASRCST